MIESDLRSEIFFISRYNNYYVLFIIVLDDVP